MISLLVHLSCKEAVKRLRDETVVSGGRASQRKHIGKYKLALSLWISISFINQSLQF